MDGVYIRWTTENWFTVILMAAGGYLIFAIAAQIFLKPKVGGGAPNLRVVA